MTFSLPHRSQLDHLVAPDRFWWAAGIEDTFITAPHPNTGRTLDEYELTGHDARWRTDLDLFAHLDVPAVRYGLPWHRIEPEPGRFDWRLADERLGRLLDLGIDPQVDLVHYGLPAWIDGAFLNPAYPELVATYARRFAERFHRRIRWVTPLNEPRITAWYCGRLGWWPPFERSWRGFVRVMIAIARGIVETVRALAEVDPEIVPYHVDATDLYTAETDDTRVEAERRQQLVFLALDLVSGRVGADHPLRAWLLLNGATEADLSWFGANAIDLPVIGMNLYPMFTEKRLGRDGAGRLRIRMPYASGDLLTRLGRLYHARYGAPLTVSETASAGSVARRARWLAASVDAVRDLRAAGVPLVGYTWWPLFSLVTWAYRQGTRPVEHHLARMGLWDLAPRGDDPLARIETPLVGAYRELVRAGPAAAGPLGVPGTTISPAPATARKEA